VLSQPRDTAEAVARALDGRTGARKPALAVWIGADAQATAILGAAGVPTYASEAEAVRGFMYLVRHREAQQALMETPPSLPQDFVVDGDAARAVVAAALASGQPWLQPDAIARLFAAYGIPLAPSRAAADADEAARIAAPLLAGGGTVAVKLLSPDIAHKSDVDGVRLDLASDAAVRDAAGDILRRARERRPDARIDGLLVQPMARRAKAREVIAG